MWGVTQIFYWSPDFRICTGCLQKYKWNLLKISFENTYFQVFQGFPALKETVAHIQPNGQFWTVFGQNGKNGENYQKSALLTLLTVKFQKKVMNGFREKSFGRTYGRTYVRTNMTPKVSTTSSRPKFR